MEIPKLLLDLRALDSGSGFYLTSRYKQAQRWAKVVHRRRQVGQPTLNSYVFDKQQASALKLLRFQSANADWLEFIVHNRKLLAIFDYDIVIDPVANDNMLPVIDDYMDGRYIKEEAVKRLLPQNLTDQYAFCSELALVCLTFKRSELL